MAAEVEEEQVVKKEESVWDVVEKGLSELKLRLDGNSSTVDGNRTADGEPITELHLKIYTAIYNYCTATENKTYNNQQAYTKYKEVFVQYMDDTVLPSLREKHDEYMLKELQNRWKNQGLMLRWLFRYFNYIDRFFLPKHNMPSLNEAGVVCFRDKVYEEIKGAVKDLVLKLIDQEREGEQIDKALVKNIVDIFVDIGLGDISFYTNDFEEYLLEESVKYYSRKASMWVQEESFPAYLLKAEECFKREKERVGHYLHSNTENKLLKKVLHVLVSVHANQLLENEESEFHVLLHNDKREDLSRMFRLFSKVNHGLDPVARIFKEHVTSEGMALVSEAEDAASNKQEGKRNIVGLQEQVFMSKVIELHDKYMNYLVECFQNHNVFHKALQESFVVFCNKTVAGSSCAELLATFCDDVLRKGGSEKLSDEALDETLDNVVKLLSYINDKDLFAEFSRKKLARRLLLDKSAKNDNHERSILTKLKQQYGGQFTYKMEGMVTDIALSREKQKPFEEFLNSKMTKQLGMDLTVTTLTTGFWPSYKFSDLNLPSEMVKCVEAFKEFYETTTNNRKLTWIYSLGSCHINAKFDTKNIELIVSTYQAAVLLLFNASERLSYSEIVVQLNLADDDVIRLLHSLSCAKYKILIKEPNTKNISRTDIFSFNSKFTDRMNRIKIPLPPVNEKKRVVEDVAKDRRYAIDAAVVRIMKSRKVLDHQQLIMECVKQLAHMFKPDIKVIKKSIEDLIIRDYLERDEENPNLYRYLA